MKVIIAGGRDFGDYHKLVDVCGMLLVGPPGRYEVVSGGARGADTLGARYAREYGCALTSFLADWAKHGKSAGYVRNDQMAKYADGLIAFWDGKSRGTRHMINLALDGGLWVHVSRY